MLTIGDYLKNNPDYNNTTLPLLPLMHSCECFDARNILSTQELEARFCNVFKEKLLYFYYGKPSYPVGEKVDKYRTDLEYLPVCFIVDTRKIYIHKVYPFDSGAFLANVYSDFLHRHMKIESFELPCNENGIKSYLSFMFENNENYFDGIATKRDETGEANIDALLNMMTAKGTMKFDERARTIEVITKNNVQLTDSLKCVILPKNLLQDENIANFLNTNNVDIITYNVRQLVHPTKYYGQIVEKALSYIETQKENLLV